MADEEDIDRLLARGYLSGSQYDEIEERVLGGPATSVQRVRLRRIVPAALAFAGLAAAVAFWPRAPSEFTAKGNLAGDVGMVDVSCGRPSPHECRIGDTMIFTVNSALASGYLAAYAVRVGAAEPERIWYFPATDEAGPKIAPGSGTIVLPQGVRVGPEHTVGRYAVTLRLSKTPLARAAVERADRSDFVVHSLVSIEVLPGGQP